MPQFCIVVGCGSRSNRDAVSFYAIPSVLHHKHKTDLNVLSQQRRERWIAAIKRDDLTETKLKNQKVCSRHFLTGKPALLEDVNHPDWAPSQLMGHSGTSTRKRPSDVAREERHGKRRREEPEFSGSTKFEDVQEVPLLEIEGSDDGVFVQTDITMDQLAKDFENLDFAAQKLSNLENQIQKQNLTFDSLANNDVKCKYYTGLSYNVLVVVYEYVRDYIPYHPNTVLDKSSQLLLTLMKLRLNLDFKDLAFRFNVSQSTVSNYFEITVEVLYQRLKCFIVWPDRETLKKNIPTCFKEVFHDRTTVIVDCFEVFIQRPSNLLTHAQCWSNYKHHATIKFLIGITPQGTICFISEAWGGRVSDKQITEQSDFLNFISPTDIVMADRGFLIKEDLAVRNAKLVIPAFTKGKKQLHPLEIEETRAVAHVRIHVERVIGLVKNKFRIFKDTIPLTMVCNISEDNKSILDKVVVVCCALVNISPPIVPI